jgi:rare lipoprotein A
MQVSARWFVSAAILAASLPPAYADTKPADAGAGWSESGEATWYGPRHAGHRTTSGETFDPEKLTAAHPSLPIGAWVRVTVDNTGASVVVRVNDREPHHGVRCIDLSHAAAARLGMIRSGVADVTLARVSGPDEVEVAEAPDDAQPVEARHAAARHVSARHGRLHRRPAHQ